MAAVEDELQVAAHGEDAGTPPAFLFEFVEVVGLEVEAIDADETNEWQEHCLVAEAQLGTGSVESDAAVGIGYELSQEEALTGGLSAAVEFAGPVLDVPEGIVDLPHQVEVVGVEEAHQIGVLIVIDVQLEEAHLHEVIAELLFIDHLLHDIGVLEDELHQSGVTQTVGDIGIVGLLRLGRHIPAQLAVLVVHVPLVALGGLHGDLELGAHLEHLHEAGAHGLDATGHHRADATDRGTGAQHLGETLRHALAYLLELSLAIAREFAPAVLGVAHDDVHLAEYPLSFGCQFVEAVGLLHHHIGDVVAAAAADVTGAMPAVVGDIERLLAFGRGRERRGDAVRIDVVVAGGIRRGLLNQLHHLGLGPSEVRGERREESGEQGHYQGAYLRLHHFFLAFELNLRFS